jgi:hypothetical protein
MQEENSLKFARCDFRLSWKKLSAKRPVDKRFCRQKSCRENGIDS